MTPSKTMDSTAETASSRRKYRRRSDDERIADLERRIAELKKKQVAQQKKQDPVLREIPKLQRRLRKVAQLAMDHDRPDIANSITAFNAGLDRMARPEQRSTRPAPAE